MKYIPAIYHHTFIGKQNDSLKKTVAECRSDNNSLPVSGCVCASALDNFLQEELPRNRSKTLHYFEDLNTILSVPSFF